MASSTPSPRLLLEPELDQRIGNPSAAQDLYGVGVRVGLYLQGLAMILYLYSGGENRGKGLKIASGTIAGSILASWVVIAVRRQFSPSEAIVVLEALMPLTFPAKLTIGDDTVTSSEIVALAIFALAELGIRSSLLWTFSDLVNVLPTLNTDNVVFCFSRVAINGWFKQLALMYCSANSLSSIRFARRVFIAIFRAAVSTAAPAASTAAAVVPTTASAPTTTTVHIIAPAASTTAAPTTTSPTRRKSIWNPEDLTGLLRNKEETRWYKILPRMHFLLWLNWLFSVVFVELTLRWNHLSPSTDLQSAGQLISLVTGMIVLLDSVSAVVCRLSGLPGGLRVQLRAGVEEGLQNIRGLPCFLYSELVDAIVSQIPKEHRKRWKKGLSSSSSEADNPPMSTG